MVVSPMAGVEEKLIWVELRLEVSDFKVMFQLMSNQW